MTSETTLRNAIARYLRSLKNAGQPIEFNKLHGSAMARAGEPDWDICYHGQAIKLEAKTQNKKPTKLQKHRLNQWACAGAVTGVVYSVNDVRYVLCEVERKYEDDQPDLEAKQ